MSAIRQIFSDPRCFTKLAEMVKTDDALERVAKADYPLDFLAKSVGGFQLPAELYTYRNIFHTAIRPSLATFKNLIEVNPFVLSSYPLTLNEIRYIEAHHPEYTVRNHQYATHYEITHDPYHHNLKRKLIGHPRDLIGINLEIYGGAIEVIFERYLKRIVRSPQSLDVLYIIGYSHTLSPRVVTILEQSPYIEAKRLLTAWSTPPPDLIPLDQRAPPLVEFPTASPALAEPASPAYTEPCSWSGNIFDLEFVRCAVDV